MSSQTMYTQLSNIHPLAHIPGTYQQLHHFHSLPKPQHVMAVHPSSGDKPPELGREVQENVPSKNGGMILNHLHLHHCSSLFPICIVAEPPLTSLPSIQPNLQPNQQHNHSYTLLFNDGLSTCPNHLYTL